MSKAGGSEMRVDRQAQILRAMHERVAQTIFDALREGDVERLRPFLTAESTWELSGRSALAGTHRGADAILGVLRRVAELRPIRPDAYDVMASEYHAVLTTRLIADGLDSDHAIVVVADADGRLDRTFHYLFDLYAFDAFFAGYAVRCSATASRRARIPPAARPRACWPGAPAAAGRAKTASTRRAAPQFPAPNAASPPAPA